MKVIIFTSGLLATDIPPTLFYGPLPRLLYYLTADFFLKYYSIQKPKNRYNGGIGIVIMVKTQSGDDMNQN